MLSDLTATMQVRAGRFHWPARLAFLPASLGAALAVAMVPGQAEAAPRKGQAALQSKSVERDVRAFYQERGNRPIWTRGSSLGPEAERLLLWVETADLDGLDPRSYRPRALASAIRKANGGSGKALAKAEMLLSETLASYVRDVRALRDSSMVFADPRALRPPATTSAVLGAAASAPSLQHYVEYAGWMHPIYTQLRRALIDVPPGSAQEHILRANLERARALPANPGRRYVLVDTAAARLFMYEDGRVRDSMKVVVGQAAQQTPMIASTIRYAMVNPYWNVPPDLAQTSIAPNVLSKGRAFLRTKRYQVLSDWSDKAKVVDPATINWKEVAAGGRELRIRQLPGPNNAMGKMKFMFPNDLGIYLHDTPERNLFKEANRQFSSG